MSKIYFILATSHSGEILVFIYLVGQQSGEIPMLVNSGDHSGRARPGLRVEDIVEAGHGQGAKVSLDHLEGDTGVMIDPGTGAGGRDINPIDKAFAFLIFSSFRDFYRNSED